MRLFDIVPLYGNEDIDPGSCKIHLAGWNGQENPLDVFLSGGFSEWQSWQSKRNFERKYILSLINMPQPNKWMFAGLYEKLDREEFNQGAKRLFKYRTRLLEAYDDLAARLFIGFDRPSRNSYLNADRYADFLEVIELKEKRIEIEEFSGYQYLKISKQKLETIISRQLPSWKSALSSVAGVYLITDTETGKQYVGSACGLGGIWGRWASYSSTGHGGNKELRQLLKEKGPQYAEHFQFTVLEIADTHASEKDILARESYWKDVLLTRKFGYNQN